MAANAVWVARGEMVETEHRPAHSHGTAINSTWNDDRRRVVIIDHPIS